MKMKHIIPAVLFASASLTAGTADVGNRPEESRQQCQTS